MADFPHTYTKLIHPQIIDELWLKKSDGTYGKMPFGDDETPVSINWDDIQGKPPVISFGENQEEARAAIGAISSSDIPELPTEERLVPTGGNVGQILKKTENGTEWVQEEEQTTYSNMLQAVADGKVSTTGELISSVVLNTTIGNRITDLRGKPNGLASLDASGVVPMNELNVSGLEFKGAWDASTNTPALIDGTGVVGNFYKVSTAGTFNFGNGEYVFQVGDWVMYAGGTWQRIGVHESVTSVNGQTGAVVIPDAPVTSVNGQTGDIVIPSSPVQSVNGKTGNVVLNAVNVGAKPSSYAPSWDEVTSKPSRLYIPRNRVSPPIQAFYRIAGSVQSLPNTAFTALSIFSGNGFDDFTIRNGSTFTVPAWATKMRVTAQVTFDAIDAGKIVWLGIRYNGAFIATTSNAGYGTISRPVLNLISGCHGVDGGQNFSIEAWHNKGSALNTTSYSNFPSFLNVEFFETLPE